MTSLTPNIVVYPNGKIKNPLNFNVHKFNDGSILVKLESSVEFIKKLSSIKVGFSPLSLNDVMIATQMVSIVKILNPKIEVELFYLTTLYTRYDRIMNEDQTDAFGLKLFIQSLTPLLVHTDVITLVDIHNADVTASLILDIKPTITVKQLGIQSVLKYNRLEIDDYHIVAPDAGCESRLKEDGITPSFVFNKNRVNGKVLSTVVVKQPNNLVSGKSLLIVDDICEEGSTFLETVKQLPLTVKHFRKILYVTYGVLPTDNSIINLSEVFDEIYITVCHSDIYFRIKQLEHGGVIPRNKFKVCSALEHTYDV